MTELVIPRRLHLLPETSTLFEKALAASTSLRLDNIPAPLRSLWRWDECPSSHLAWLAWAVGVDFWIDSWPDTKKREVIRNSFKLHRIKGTLGGQRAFISLAGSELYRSTLPPAKNFLGRSATVAERSAVLEKLPQIRIFPARRTANAGFRGFWRGKHGPWFQDAAGKSDCFPREVDPRTKITTRAVYVYNGVTTELRWTAMSDNGEQVLMPSKARGSAFTSSFMGHCYFRKSDAKDRIVTLNLDRDGAIGQLLYRFPVVPKATAVNIVPDRIGQHGFAPRSVFSGTPIGPSEVPEGGAPNGRRFFVRSGAKYRTYDVVYFKDANVTLDGRAAHNFMGYQRFGMPTFTAELKVVVPGKRPKWAADRFVGGYFYKAPKETLANTIAASRIAKSARDDVLLNTKVARPLLIGTPLLLGGELRLGQYTRS